MKITYLASFQAQLFIARVLIATESWTGSGNEVRVTNLVNKHCGTFPTVTVYPSSFAITRKGPVTAALLCQSVIKINVNMPKETNMPGVCVFRASLTARPFWNEMKNLREL